VQSGDTQGYPAASQRLPKNLRRMGKHPVSWRPRRMARSAHIITRKRRVSVPSSSGLFRVFHTHTGASSRPGQAI
jgi:hypothetical protein